MRVMGIDPGLTRCGVGTVDVESSRKLSLVYVGVIRSSAEVATHFRLLKISEGIAEAIARFDPDIVAMERAFAQNNRQSVLTTMSAMGAGMTEVARGGKPLALYTPSEVKAAVSGNGNAPKSQVEAMVARILGLKNPPKPADAADALAVAIAHAWKQTGILGAGQDADFVVSASGGVRTRSGTKLTAAQRAWAQAEAKARRSGVAKH